MEKLKQFIEKKIRSCDELGGMEREKWAFIQVLKYIRKNEKTKIHKNRSVSK